MSVLPVTAAISCSSLLGFLTGETHVDHFPGGHNADCPGEVNWLVRGAILGYNVNT